MFVSYESFRKIYERFACQEGLGKESTPYAPPRHKDQEDCMKASPFDRLKKIKLAFGVLAVALMVCGLLAIMLFFMSRQHPRL